MFHNPAADRNKEPILEKLKQILPGSVTKVLEIASGPGQHVAHFAKALPHITWQPTECDVRYIPSIQAFIDQERLKNVKSPLVVDVTKSVDGWPLAQEDRSFDVIYCCNMIHITPWACTLGLFTAASCLLKSNGLLITYGPYAKDGVLCPESNVNFDRGLRAQNPEWGIRDVKDLRELAQSNGLKFQQSFDMPANNKILVFNKI